MPFFDANKIKISVSNEKSCVQIDDNSQRLKKKVVVRLHRLTAAEIAQYQTVRKIKTSKEKDERITRSKTNGKLLKCNVQEDCSKMVNTKGKPKTVDIVDKATNKRRSDYCIMTRSKRRRIQPNNEQEVHKIEEKVNEASTHDENTLKIDANRLQSIDEQEFHMIENKIKDGVESKQSKNTSNIDDEQKSSNDRSDMTSKAVAIFPFDVDGKIRGWPHWPAKVLRIERRRFEVEWFNDYRRTKLFRSQM